MRSHSFVSMDDAGVPDFTGGIILCIWRSLCVGNTPLFLRYASMNEKALYLGQPGSDVFIF